MSKRISRSVSPNRLLNEDSLANSSSTISLSTAGHRVHTYRWRYLQLIKDGLIWLTGKRTRAPRNSDSARSVPESGTLVAARTKMPVKKILRFKQVRHRARSSSRRNQMLKTGRRSRSVHRGQSMGRGKSRSVGRNKSTKKAGRSNSQFRSRSQGKKNGVFKRQRSTSGKPGSKSQRKPSQPRRSFSAGTGFRFVGVPGWAIKQKPRLRLPTGTRLSAGPRTSKPRLHHATGSRSSRFVLAKGPRRCPAVKGAKRSLNTTTNAKLVWKLAGPKATKRAVPKASKLAVWKVDCPKASKLAVRKVDCPKTCKLAVRKVDCPKAMEPQHGGPKGKQTKMGPKRSPRQPQHGGPKGKQTKMGPKRSPAKTGVKNRRIVTRSVSRQHVTRGTFTAYGPSRAYDPTFHKPTFIN